MSRKLTSAVSPICFSLPRCFSRSNSPSPTVFHADHIIWIHFRAMDRRCHLILRCAIWRCRRVLAVTHILARNDFSLAYLDTRFMSGSPSSRTQTTVVVLRQTRALPIQCAKRAPCSHANANHADLCHLHGLVPFQSDRAYQHWCRNSLV
jgi:hypothetical protein